MAKQTWAVLMTTPFYSFTLFMVLRGGALKKQLDSSSIINESSNTIDMLQKFRQEIVK
jgi:hypothetical protein